MNMTDLYRHVAAFWRMQTRLSELNKTLHRVSAFACTFQLPRIPNDEIFGDPLYEAWTADGEPLDRITAQQLAQSQPSPSSSRHWIVPHGRAH
jgi:hypothetical protein